MINQILSSYSEMNHEIIEPQPFDLSKYNINQNNYPVKIKDKFSNHEISFDNLSSGETILFALTLTIFKEKLKSSLPKLLLLDEIDATLHPSMIKNLLKVINEFFIAKGTKVILATHSPSTIALCETESIFVIDRKKDQLIQKQSKQEALFNLTDGFASIEEGFHFFDQVGEKDITIITEGKNTRYIEKAIELFAEGNKDKIGVILNAESIANDTKLKVLFDFFAKVDHKKKIIFVWDPDCTKYNKLKSTETTHAYVFPCNYNNTITKRGIENLFDDEYFMTETSETSKVGKYIIVGEMDTNRKNRFRKRMLDNATTDSFKNFKHLFEHIDDILNQRC